MPQQETPSSDTLSIDSRYCGPPDSANGGYVGGLLATALGTTTATLSRASCNTKWIIAAAPRFFERRARWLGRSAGLSNTSYE